MSGVAGPSLRWWRCSSPLLEELEQRWLQSWGVLCRDLGAMEVSLWLLPPLGGTSKPWNVQGSSCCSGRQVRCHSIRLASERALPKQHHYRSQGTRWSNPVNSQRSSSGFTQTRGVFLLFSWQDLREYFFHSLFQQCGHKRVSSRFCTGVARTQVWCSTSALSCELCWLSPECIMDFRITVLSALKWEVGAKCRFDWKWKMSKPFLAKKQEWIPVAQRFRLRQKLGHKPWPVRAGESCGCHPTPSPGLYLKLKGQARTGNCLPALGYPGTGERWGSRWKRAHPGCSGPTRL